MDNMDYRLRCAGVFMPVKDAACPVTDADFEESKHPRGEGGKFAPKGAGASSGKNEEFDRVNKSIQSVHREMSKATRGHSPNKGELGISTVRGLLESLQGGTQYSTGNLHKITEGLLRDAELSPKEKKALIGLKTGLEGGANYSSANVAAMFAPSRKEIANKVTQEHLEMEKDPGKMREYVAKKYGPVLFEGGDGLYMRQGKQYVAKIAKMTGQSEKAIMKDLRKDYEAIYGDSHDGSVKDCASTIQALKERVAKDGGPGSGPRPGGGSSSPNTPDHEAISSKAFAFSKQASTMSPEQHTEAINLHRAAEKALTEHVKTLKPYSPEWEKAHKVAQWHRGNVVRHQGLMKPSRTVSFADPDNVGQLGSTKR